MAARSPPRSPGDIKDGRDRPLSSEEASYLDSNRIEVRSHDGQGEKNAYAIGDIDPTTGGVDQIGKALDRMDPDPSSTGVGVGVRKRDWGFVPIPKNRRHDPRLLPEECFPWSTRINLVFAICSVCSAIGRYD